MMKTQDGRLIVVSGASRCGKTTHISRLVKNSRRAVAWDPEAQWCELPGWRKVTTRKELLAAIMTTGYMRIAYVAGGELKEEFNYLCACVFHAGRFLGPLDFVAEELADVTTQSKAPGHWGILVRRGLKRGINIYPISQRWSEADKTAIGNASEYIVFSTRPKDVKYVAGFTGLSIDEITLLKPFEFFTLDPVTKEKSKNKIRFTR